VSVVGGSGGTATCRHQAVQRVCSTVIRLGGVGGPGNPRVSKLEAHVQITHRGDQPVRCGVLRCRGSWCVPPAMPWRAPGSGHLVPPDWQPRQTGQRPGHHTPRGYPGEPTEGTSCVPKRCLPTADTQATDHRPAARRTRSQPAPIAGAGGRERHDGTPRPPRRTFRRRSSAAWGERGQGYLSRDVLGREGPQTHPDREGRVGKDCCGHWLANRNGIGRFSCPPTSVIALGNLRFDPGQ
jgi:hypothetical protein